LDRIVTEEQRIVSARRVVKADPAVVFELIADPARQPEWDGNDNLATAEPGQRVRAAGEVFTTTLTNGHVRDNQVEQFVEGRLIAWRPRPQGQTPPGHLWRWELTPITDGAEPAVEVVHTYDWTELTDESRFPRARATTADKLQGSVDRLAALAEGLR
jgi:uncharacterized protein YndB with AHSA1/START domain